MENERASIITIGGRDYELLLTMRATKEITARFGGLSQLGTDLEQSENMEKSLEDLSWLIVLLANQSILQHNFENPNEKRDLLTAEELELFTMPRDIAGFKDAIVEALVKGTRRDIESTDEGAGDDSKNS